MIKKSGLADSPFFKPANTEPETPSPVEKDDRPNDEEAMYTATQKPTQLRKPLRKPANEPSSEAIEQMSFVYRKQSRARVCGDVPPQWKRQLEDMAYELQVGRYELVMYIIGRFLGELDGDGSEVDKSKK